MSDYTDLFPNSHISKPHPIRLYCTKSSNSSPFHNQQSPKLLNSFIDFNLRKDLASSPTGSASCREDRSPLGFRKEGLERLNYEKFTLYGGERVNSLTWRNEANTDNINSRNDFLNTSKEMGQQSRKTSELRDNLFALISQKHREEKESSPKSPAKGNLYRMKFKSQNQSLTSDCSLTLKKQLTDSKLKEVSTSTSKVIDAEHKKIDAQLCLGESLNLSNISESPHEGKADYKQGTFGSMVEERKKLPISEVYKDLLKKHMTNPSVTSRPNTKRTSAKMVNGRPQTCKHIVLPNEEKAAMTPKEKQYLSALQKFKNANLGSPREVKPSKPAPRVASARVATPKAEPREPVTVVRDDKPRTQKRNSPKKITVRPESESLKEVASCIPLRAKKDLLHSVSNYKFERVLGHGAYAVVKLAWDKVRAEKVAVKVYEKNIVLDPRKMKNVRREISILKDMDHSNIIRLLDSFDTPKQVYVVMEFVGKASLHSYLKSLGSKKLEESEIKRIFGQVCSGMKYCHQKNIVHRDIKMENILIDDNNNAKIIDFGFSMNVSYDKRLDTYCGTPSYMAPEIVTKTPYKGAPADIWALGVLVYVLLCGHYPFKGSDDRDLSHKIRKAKVEFPSEISEEAKAFVQKLLEANPDERLRIDEVLQERWLNS